MAHCLRDTYTDENKVSKFLNDASYDRVTLNELVNQMRSSRYPLTSVEALKAVSPTTVNNFVKSHKEKYIQQAEALFIPDEAITERLKQMDKVCEELSDLARKINDLLAKYEGVALKIDSKGAFWWDEKQLKALAQKQATTAFNELDKQYYQLLGACVDALEALRKFEEENKLVHFSRAEPWQNEVKLQDFFKGERPKDPFTISPKEFLWLKRNEQILAEDR